MSERNLFEIIVKGYTMMVATEASTAIIVERFFADYDRENVPESDYHITESHSDGLTTIELKGKVIEEICKEIGLRPQRKYIQKGKI